MGNRRFSRNARFSVGLALIFSIYSLPILGFCIGASGSLSRIAGALGLQQQSRQSIQGIQGSLGLRRSIVAVAPLRAKKKKVDPEREAKRRAAAEKRELAKRKAEEEKRKLAGLDPLPPAPPPTRAVKKPAVAKPPALPPVPVRAPAKGRRKKGVDPEREAKRMRAAEAREEAKRRAEEERQKLQADQSVKEIDFTKLTVVEIKEELRKRGLKVSGKKQELIQRLQGKEASQGGDDSGSQAPEYAKMKVAELREELKKLGEKTTGRKAELVERLAACQTSNAKGTPSVGQKFRGKVAGLSKWGAFVDIGLSRPALVRTSRLAERHVRDASEVVQSGEEVDVWVYRVAPDGRLGLSMIEYPSSKLQDPVSAFEGVSSRKWFKGVVRYQADREFFVDVLAPQGAGVQGKLAKSAVSSPEKVSAGQELEVRVLEVIANTGTLRLSAKPPI
eukprot:symbB.v1.2.022424.t1/scaffold1980.1/size93873/2